MVSVYGLCTLFSGSLGPEVPRREWLFCGRLSKVVATRYSSAWSGKPRSYIPFSPYFHADAFATPGQAMRARQGIVRR